MFQLIGKSVKVKEVVFKKFVVRNNKVYDYVKFLVQKNDVVLQCCIMKCVIGKLRKKGVFVIVDVSEGFFIFDFDVGKENRR